MLQLLQKVLSPCEVRIGKDDRGHWQLLVKGPLPLFAIMLLAVLYFHLL